MTLASSISLKVSADLASALDLVTPVAPLSFSEVIALATGTAADQADLIFSDTRTLAASADEDLDLAASLSDALGNSLTFARVKAIIVTADSGNTNDVEVGGASANQFINWVGDATDKIVVKPGGMFALVAPDATAYEVTAATGDLLNIANSGAGTGVTYSIIIIGASA